MGAVCTRTTEAPRQTVTMQCKTHDSTGSVESLITDTPGLWLHHALLNRVSGMALERWHLQQGTMRIYRPHLRAAMSRPLSALLSCTSMALS
jgi:hypothetical protein